MDEKFKPETLYLKMNWQNPRTHYLEYYHKIIEISLFSNSEWLRSENKRMAFVSEFMNTGKPIYISALITQLIDFTCQETSINKQLANNFQNNT